MSESEKDAYRLNKSRMLQNFRDMIRIPTVSCDDESETDRNAFRQLKELFRECYPALLASAEWEEVGPYGLLIRIPGKKAGKPAVLMAHMDVVPADPADWDTDPFAAEIRNDRIFGRGTLDTKSTLWAILEAAEYRAANGFSPGRDIWLSFGGEEETCGSTCPMIVETLRRRDVKPAFVLDEGGSVIPEGLPGFKKEAAVIGIAEKGTANVRLVLEDRTGGHASTPPHHTLIGKLSKAAVRIEKDRFPAKMSTAVREMFHALAREVPFYERFLFAHAERLEMGVSLLSRFMGPSVNAMVRTTTAVTISQGGTVYNVLPQRAELGVNLRLIEGDSLDYAMKRLEKAAATEGLRAELVSGTEATPAAPVDTEEYTCLTDVIRTVWPGIVCVPYQMNGGTDARFYSVLTDRIYRFSPMRMNAEERASVHGRNESISISNLMRIPVFYLKLMEVL